MSLWIFLKVFGDLCLYFSVISAFPGLFVHCFSFFWPILLCAAGGSAAALLSGCGRPRLRFFALLLPLSSLILVQSRMELLLLLLPLIYTAVVISRGRLSLEYYSFRQTFLRSFLPWGLIFAVLFLFQYVEEVYDLAQTLLDCRAMFRFGLLYAFSGVLLLRRLRIGQEDRAQQRMSRRQLLLTLCLSALGLVGVVVLERILHDSATSLLRVIYYGFFSALLLPIYQLFLRFIEHEADRIVDFAETVHPSQSPEPTASLPPELPPSEPITQAAAGSGFPWWLVALILAVLLVGMVFLLRAFRSRTAGSFSAETVERTAPVKRERPPGRQSNRGKVRHLYRQFLKEEQKKGLRRKPSFTSADVQQRISPTTDAEAAAELRAVYLHARYNDRAAVTAEQVEEAKRALKRSRRS